MRNKISKAKTNALKGMAILLVIVGHISIRYSDNWLNGLGAVGVAIFLFISGYGLVESYNKNGLEGYWKKRFDTVMIPYIVVMMIWIGIDIIRGYRYSVSTYVLTIIGFDFNRTIEPTMWYISYILIWYLIFYIVFRCIKGNVIRLTSMFLCSLAFLCLYFFNISTKMTYQYAIHCLSFPLGVIYSMYGHKLHEILYGYKKVISGGIATIAFVLLYLNMENGLVIICANLLLVFILSLITPLIKIKSNFLEVIGRYSYELYLVEGYFIFRTDMVNDEWENTVLYILIISIMSIVLKRIICLILKQNSIRKN